MKILFILAIALLVSGRNDAPIIGLLTLPNRAGTSKSFIQAESVKFIESSGGRV